MPLFTVKLKHQLPHRPVHAADVNRASAPVFRPPAPGGGGGPGRVRVVDDRAEHHVKREALQPVQLNAGDARVHNTRVP